MAVCDVACAAALREGADSGCPDAACHCIPRTVGELAQGDAARAEGRGGWPRSLLDCCDTEIGLRGPVRGAIDGGNAPWLLNVPGPRALRHHMFTHLLCPSKSRRHESRPHEARKQQGGCSPSSASTSRKSATSGLAGIIRHVDRCGDTSLAPPTTRRKSHVPARAMYEGLGAAAQRCGAALMVVGRSRRGHPRSGSPHVQHTDPMQQQRSWVMKRQFGI